MSYNEFGDYDTIDYWYENLQLIKIDEDFLLDMNKWLFTTNNQEILCKYCMLKIYNFMI
jgi:hypothetical protein